MKLWHTDPVGFGSSLWQAENASAATTTHTRMSPGYAIVPSSERAKKRSAAPWPVVARRPSARFEISVVSPTLTTEDLGKAEMR